jgi:hypothetical protein
MEGQAAVERVDKTVDERFQVMAAVNCSGEVKGQWYPAIPPLTRCYTGLSPSDYFGRTLVANLPDSIKVGIINVSVAGCKIELFDKDKYENYVATAPSWMLSIIDEYDGNPYSWLVDLAKLAQNDGVIKGFLMHQGESNTGESDWPVKVKIIYDNLLNDLGLQADSIPLLAGEVVHADQGGVCASMNSIIATLPETIPNAHVISSSGCTDAADNLHFNAAGYRKIGKRYAVQMLSLMGYESVYAEAECATVGGNWNVLEDADASNRAYVTVRPGWQSIDEVPSGEENMIHFTFSLPSDTTYAVFGRFNCPSPNADAFWIKLDDGSFEKFDELTTTGWQWIELYNRELSAGEHTLTIAYCEEGAALDNIGIKNSNIEPIDAGLEAVNTCVPEYTTVGVNGQNSYNGYSLNQNFPNPFSKKTTITFTLPERAFVSMKIFNLQGIEITELGGKYFTSGQHKLDFDSQLLPEGIYFYKINTGNFNLTRKMTLLNE